jgi:Transposase and inactivated derivatives
MRQLYETAGISKQGFHQGCIQKGREEYSYQRLIEMVKEVRKEHPRMGARPMYYKLNMQGIGINKFEKFISNQGLGIRKERKRVITTFSNHNMEKYQNLIYGLKLDNVNQLWSSDITYWITLKETYYITFIQDVYSRRILGYKVSNNMFTENNIEVLETSFKIRGLHKYNGLIHHSDKGSQYCSRTYIKALKDASIKISMANNSIENGYSERLNGIIKNDYLCFMDVTTPTKLVKSLDKVVWLYNNERPHSELGYMTPVAYEKYLEQLTKDNRLILKLYDFKENSNGF